MTERRFQIIVIGSGFGGSLTAMIARKLGFSVALLERGKHPRFAIGESSTPLANLLLEQIARDYELAGILPLCKWGTWQRHLPQIACGLKRGFTFFHHKLGQAFDEDNARQRQLMVGASPRDEVADTHWYRPDFDRYLVAQAQGLGVEYWDELNLINAASEANGMRLHGTRLGKPVHFHAELVVDATGPRGFLHRSLCLPKRSLPFMPQTQALFAHFRQVAPLPDGFACRSTPPYPPEDAAVHHVFDGGWIWVLKFNNGVTSAGVAATDAMANELNFAAGEPAWTKLLSRLPSLRECFQRARVVSPFMHQPRITFQSGRIHGSNWVLLPSAAGVIDPLLSTGFPLTLLGVTRLARILRADWGRPAMTGAMAEYAAQTNRELEVTARLVGALYATMSRFELFKALSLMYFVAASFSETAHRLGKPELADGFLLYRNSKFSSLLCRCCDAACQPLTTGEAVELQIEIRSGLEPFDVAGLTDRARDPWYPARAEDVIASAAKLGATRDEVNAMLRKCGIN